MVGYISLVVKLMRLSATLRTELRDVLVCQAEGDYGAPLRDTLWHFFLVARARPLVKPVHRAWLTSLPVSDAEFVFAEFGAAGYYTPGTEIAWLYAEDVTHTQPLERPFISGALFVPNPQPPDEPRFVVDLGWKWMSCPLAEGMCRDLVDAEYPEYGEDSYVCTWDIGTTIGGDPECRRRFGSSKCRLNRAFYRGPGLDQPLPQFELGTLRGAMGPHAV